MDYKELILFVIAVFGSLFGVYQFIKKNSKDDREEAKDTATQNALIMNELKHIGANVDVIKTEVKTISIERSKDREDILILGERHDALAGKVETAFSRIDEVRSHMVQKKDFDELRRDIEEIKK